MDDETAVATTTGVAQVFDLQGTAHMNIASEEVVVPAGSMARSAA